MIEKDFVYISHKALKFQFAYSMLSARMIYCMLIVTFVEVT